MAMIVDVYTPMSCIANRPIYPGEKISPEEEE